MAFICTKYPQSDSISKSQHDNSRKNATIREPVFQIGLRSEKEAIYEEMILREFAGKKPLLKGGGSHRGNTHSKKSLPEFFSSPGVGNPSDVEESLWDT